MSNVVKVRKVGNSLALTLTESLKAMGLDEGDQLYVSTTESGIELSRFDPDFSDAVEAAQRFMKKHPNAMKALAK